MTSAGSVWSAVAVLHWCVCVCDDECSEVHLSYLQAARQSVCRSARRCIGQEFMSLKACC